MTDTFDDGWSEAECEEAEVKRKAAEALFVGLARMPRYYDQRVAAGCMNRADADARTADITAYSCLPAELIVGSSCFIPARRASGQRDGMNDVRTLHGQSQDTAALSITS